MGSKLFHPWGETGSWAFPPHRAWHYARGGDYGESVSSLPTHLEVGIFSSVDVEEALTGLDLSERNTVYVEHR